MLTEFVKAQPLLFITLFSLALTLLTTLIYKVLTNQTRLKELREKQKQLRAEALKLKENPQKIMELQKEMLAISVEQMKAGLKPMLATFLPFLLALWFLKNIYTAAEVGNIIYWHANLPLIGDGGGWFFCYIILSLVFSLLLRKLLKIY